MRINDHSHIFTLRTVLSREAIEVIGQRLQDKGVPDFAVKAVKDLLDGLLDKPYFLNERWLWEKFFDRLKTGSVFTDVLEKWLGNSPIIASLWESLEDSRKRDLLREALDKVAEVHGGRESGKNLLDIVQTLRMAMQPTITDVADDLLAGLGPDDVIVALMMDIFGSSDPARDQRNFEQQIRGTAEAALQRPGRILPFFAVHPDRPDHLERLKDAVVNKGFVGVKLYPSLGYRVDRPELHRVYEYCLLQDLPVLQHCGTGGFYREKEDKKNCAPDEWVGILDAYKGLRLCFAHFGGWKSLAEEKYKTEGTWPYKICELMRQYPNVYTDVAYHSEMMKDEQVNANARYFQALSNLLNDSVLGGHILFGTDSWILRMDMEDKPFWARFEAGLSKEEFASITSENPRRFLGFADGPGRPMRGNLARFVNYMAANRERVGAPPAPWLQEAAAAAFSADRDPASWDFTKMAVRDTYQWFGQFLTPAQRNVGYRQNKSLRLYKLSYYDVSDPNFASRCVDMARRFIDFASQDTAYSQGHTFGSAVDLFADILRQGDMQLSEVAVTLDSVIEYPEPIC